MIGEQEGMPLEVRSAGLAHHPGIPIASNAIRAMGELGIDISSDYSKPVTDELLEWADFIVPVTCSHGEHLIDEFPDVAKKIRLLAKDVSDPFGGSLERYREVRDQLRVLLLGLVASIRQPQTGDGDSNHLHRLRRGHAGP